MFSRTSTNLIRVKQPKLKTKCQRRKFSVFGYTIKKDIGFEYTKENTTFTKVVDKELIKVQQETFDSINLESLKYDRSVRIDSALINEFSKKYSKFLTDKQLQTFSELEQLNSVSAHKVLYLEDYEEITKVIEECNKYLETGKYNPEIYTNYTYRDKVAALSQCVIMIPNKIPTDKEQNFKRSLEKLKLHDNKILSHNVFFAAYCINILRNLKTNRELLLGLSWFLTQHDHVFKHNNDLIVHKSLKYAQRRVILDCIYTFIRGIVVGMFWMFVGVIMSLVGLMIDDLFINILP